MQIQLWSQLTEKEQTNIMVVLAEIFASVGIDEISAAEWYDSGNISLIREQYGCKIVAPENPSSNNIIELARISNE